MPTIMTHALVGAALASGVSSLCRVPPKRVKAIVIAAAFFAMLPDADVIGRAFDIAYGDFWGHRGVTHSLLFAAVMGLLASLVYVRGGITIALATVSHGLLDAMTNGGRGVAFFSPFNPERYFLPFTPIEVSPIGLGFFSSRGLSVLVSEFVWVWLPVLAISLVLTLRCNSLELRTKDEELGR